MLDLLITNALIATMKNGDEPEIGSVGVKNGRIAHIKHGAADKKNLPAISTVDAASKLLTPGLIDCHTHLVYAGSRANEFAERLKGASYAEIAAKGGGIMSTVRATRVVSEDELFAQSLPRLKSLMQSGVTTVEIKSGYGLDLATERKMLRVARRLGEDVRVITSFLGAHALPPEFAGRADEYIDCLCDEMLPVLHEEGLVNAVDGYCEHLAFSVTQMEKLFNKAKSFGLPLKLHAGQLSDCGAVALAAKCRALSADHLEYVDEHDVAAMAAAETVAVMLPGAFYFLREKQKPPIELFRKHGVNMALATDCNPGTSPITSLPLAMNMGCVLFGMTIDEVWRGVTSDAAKALGLEREIGTIETGKLADIALWPTDSMADMVQQMLYPSHIFQHGVQKIF